MARQQPVEFSDFFDGRWFEVRLVPTSRGLFAYFRDVTAARRSRRAQPRVDDAGTVVSHRAARGCGGGDAGRSRAGRPRRGRRGALVRAARVVRPGGEVLASSSGRPSRATRAAERRHDRTAAGGDEADLEVEGSFPTHEAVRWAVRVLAASVAPDVGALIRGG